MLRLFKTNNEASGFLLLVGYALLLRMLVYVQPASIPFPNSTGFLTGYLYDLISPVSMTGSLVAIILVAFQAWLLAYIINQLRILKQASYYVGAFYVLLVSLHPSLLSLSGELVANTFLIFALQQLLGLYQLSKANAKIFNVGFWIGVAALFSWGYIGFLLWVILAMSIVRSLNIRVLLVLFSGVFSPWWLMWVYLFWNGKQQFLWENGILANTGWNGIQTPSFQGVDQWLFFVVMGILLLVVISSAGRLYIRQNIKSQKILQVVYIGLLLSVIPVLVARPLSFLYLLPLIPFLGVLLGIFSSRIPAATAESLHWPIIFALFFMHFGSAFL